jgi:dTDP-4-dehydrorhamnose 3,5-epimerase
MEKTTQFTVKETSLPGLLEIDITILEDARGFFQEKFQKEKLAAAGFPAAFVPVQHNISYNQERGVTRGFHAEPWDKYVSVVAGRIFAVFVDLRAENFGKKFEIEVTPAKAVYVPRGVANSFQTLEETYYSYMVNAHWQPDSSDKYKFVNLADPDLNVQWPIGLDKAIVSDKDKNHPMLKDIKPF